MLFDGHTIGTIIPALVPVADAYAGGVTTDVFCMRDYHAGAFVIFQGAIEDTGISNLVTLLACDDAVPTNTSTMAFRRRTLRYSTTVDTWGALTAVTASGYNFNSNNTVANCVHTVEFTADEVSGDGSSGYSFVQLSIAETANKTVTAGVTFYGLEGRYHGTPPGAVT